MIYMSVDNLVFYSVDNRIHVTIVTVYNAIDIHKLPHQPCVRKTCVLTIGSGVVRAAVRTMARNERVSTSDGWHHHSTTLTLLQNGCIVRHHSPCPPYIVCRYKQHIYNLVYTSI